MVDLAEGRRLLEAAGGDKTVSVGTAMEQGEWPLVIWLRNNAAELLELAASAARDDGRIA